MRPISTLLVLVALATGCAGTRDHRDEPDGPHYSTHAGRPRADRGPGRGASGGGSGGRTDDEGGGILGSILGVVFGIFFGGDDDDCD